MDISQILHYTSSAPHHALNYQKKKEGEKQQQLSGKGTVILPLSQLREGTDGQNSSSYRCFLSAEMKQRGDEGFVWARTHNGRKTNRTFAKNILVFVPLINT